jgi:hypothetical protein
MVTVGERFNWVDGLLSPDDRSDSADEWLRRAGAGRVLNRLGATEHTISLRHPKRSREWLAVAIVECERCHQVVERTSPIQRHCGDCRLALKRERSTDAVRRRRAGIDQS